MMETKSLQEADYLAALLNADSLQKAFAGSRQSDLDFSANIWRAVPIPRFDPKDGLSKSLADMGQEAAEKVEEFRGKLPKSTEQIKMSAHIRESLRQDGNMGEINKAAAKLLPKHV